MKPSDATLPSNPRVSDAALAKSLRMEAEQAFIVAEDRASSGMYAEGMALIGRKMLAGAEAIERLTEERERQQDVNVANATHNRTITADLFETRAERDRLRVALQNFATMDCFHSGSTHDSNTCPCAVAQAERALRGAVTSGESHG